MTSHQTARPPLSDIRDLDDFDFVTPEQIEMSRKSLAMTVSDFAESLGWSKRKYNRSLENAKECGFVDRDWALAVRGMLTVLEAAAPDNSVKSLTQDFDDVADDFAQGQVHFDILDTALQSSGEWTAQVTPHLLKLVAARAMQGKAITYGEAANTLEESGMTKRVWPRTLYGMPLGLICEAVLELSERTGERIPLLSVIVVKADGEPGEGIDGLIRRFINTNEPKRSRESRLIRLKRNRQKLVEEMQQEVFAYPHWPGVIRALIASD